jgi:hypothetical protein
MKTSESIKEIAAALSAAQGQFRPIPKTGENRQQGYRFADLDDHLSVVRPVLAKHGLSLVASTEELVPLPERQTRSGGVQYVVRARVVGRLLHSSGEWIEGESWGEGQDSLDKAGYKAITGARKYLVTSLLGTATGDDPERDQEQPRARGAKKAEPAPAATGDNGADEPPTSDQLDRLEGWVLDQRLPTNVRDLLAQEMAGGLTKNRAGAIIGRIKSKYASELAEGKTEPGSEG